MINYFEKHTGLNLEGDFNQYVLNKDQTVNNESSRENIHHPKLSDEEVEEIL